MLFRPDSAFVIFDLIIQQYPMPTDAYIEALLVDEDLADQVWELWDRGVIGDELAAWAWSLIQAIPSHWFLEIVAPRREAQALRAPCA